MRAASLLVTCASLLAAIAPRPALAAPHDDAPPVPGEARVAGALLVRPGLYRLDGDAAGTLLRFDTTGLVVVAAEGTSVDERSLESWKRVAGGPARRVDALVLTGPGPRQAPAIAQAVGAGIPVIVQQQSLGRSPPGGWPGAAATTGGPIAFVDDYLLRAGGFEIEIEHVGRGRTGSDSVVRFGDLGILAVGDLYTRETPVPDCASGGSFAGWAAAIDHLLWFDFDRVVASRGELAGRGELERFRRKLAALAESERTSGRPACPAAR